MRPLLLLAALSWTLPAAAAPRLWVEKTAGEARRDTVRIPSLAPLLRTLGSAVVTISTNGKAPPGLAAFGRAKPDEDEDRTGPSPHGVGTGFLVNPTGYIVTSAHVVEGSDSIEVRLGHDETPHVAAVIGLDALADLALLKIDGTDFPVLPLGDSDALEVGDFVVAMGSPFGLSDSAAFGMVSAKGRRDITPSGRTGLYDFLQVDAAINPGNSGGPLVNLRGEVVGINAAVNATGQGIGFAVPINMAKELLPELRENGHVVRGWLGVDVQKLTPERVRGFGVPFQQGALVSHVTEHGPAARAGLEPGDVITRFNGRRLTRSGDLPLLAAHSRVGTPVEMTWWREGQEHRATLTLEARPGSTPSLTRVPSGGLDQGSGLAVEDLDDALRGELELPEGVHGVIVRGVDQDGPAAAAGLRNRDVILKLNGQPVDDAEGLLQVLDGMPPGAPVRVFVRRGEQGMFLVFPRALP